MIVFRLFWTADGVIGTFPGPLKDAAAGFLVAVFVVAYTYLATGHWLRERGATSDD